VEAGSSETGSSSSVWVPIIRFGTVSRLPVSGGVWAHGCADRDPRSRLGQGVDGSGLACRKEPARSGLRRELILVEDPAEQVTAAQAIEDDHVGEWWLLLAERRPLPECPVRAMLVEMPNVCDEHVV
jgi:hypothetical protein